MHEQAPPLLSTPDAAGTGWRAHLALTFAHDGMRTRLTQRAHHGPLCVQRAFYPEGDPSCHVYLLHPPGGIVGGDVLGIDISLHVHAHALLTTPAASKCYRSAGACAQQRQHLRVAAGATCEWLPQESIVFNGARLQTQTRVELMPQARFTGWEILCLGRPAAAETFMHGSLQHRFELWREQRPLFIERGHFAGGAAVLNAAWGLGGNSVTATLVSTDHEASILPALRATTPASGSATLLDTVLVCRYLGDDVYAARAYFAQVLACIRAARGQGFSVPRIWSS